MRKIFLLVCTAVLLSACSAPSFFQKKAGLQIELTGEDKAEVFLNGSTVGTTPYEADNLKAGTYTVKLVPQDATKQPYETHVVLSPSLITGINWSFGATPDESGGDVFELSKISGKKAELSIITTPDNIVVRLDGQSKGFSPLILQELSEGEHALTLSAPGYVERTSAPKIMKGYRVTVTTKLAREAQSLFTTPVSTLSALPTPTPKATPKATPKTTTATGSATIKTQVTPPLPYVEVTQTPTGWLRVRAEASGASEEVAKLDVGVKVPYLNETTDGWHKVEYATGKTGWVSGQYAIVHSQ